MDLPDQIKSKTESFFKNGPSPASFWFISVFFKPTIQFLQQIYVKKYPSSIRRGDSNPQPLEHELSHITTRPGLLYTAPDLWGEGLN